MGGAPDLNVTYLYKHRGSPVNIHSLEDARAVPSIAVRENYFAHTQLAIPRLCESGPFDGNP